jgi:hypothetical protein
VRSVRRAGAALALVLAFLGAGCADPDPAADPPPRLGASIVQLRRDQVLKRVEVAVTNRAEEQVTIESIDLRVPGYGGDGVQVKDEPLPAGQVVNLPTLYGEVTCARDGTAQVGRPRVVIRVHTASDPTSRRVVLRPRDPDRLLPRIAAGECQSRHLLQEVSLSFGPTWRPVGTGRGRYLRGTLEARLTIDQPRNVTQVRGTVIFDLLPDPPDRPAGEPLAALTPARPTASIPVVVSRARCTGHARGEVKKPYEFLVWLAPPGGPELAVTPPVSDAAKVAFEQVCHLGVRVGGA